MPMKRSSRRSSAEARTQQPRMYELPTALDWTKYSPEGEPLAMPLQDVSMPRKRSSKSQSKKALNRIPRGFVEEIYPSNGQAQADFDLNAYPTGLPNSYASGPAQNAAPYQQQFSGPQAAYYAAQQGPMGATPYLPAQNVGQQQQSKVNAPIQPAAQEAESLSSKKVNSLMDKLNVGKLLAIS